MTVSVDAGHSPGMTTAPVADPVLRAPAQAEARVVDPVALDFDDLYDGHFDFVWRCLRRLGVDEASLDDALQDVFVVVHRRLESFEGRSSLKTWLFGIAMRVARDHRRARARRGDPMPLSLDLPDGAACPAEALERKQSLSTLDAVLATLDEDKRAVLVMVEIEEMTVPEVAHALGINVNTAYSRLRLARRDFDRAVHAAPGGER